MTTADFVAALRQHRLLEPAQLNELHNLQARFADPKALARELLHRNWLTVYQVNQIGKGRAGDLRLGTYLVLERLGEGGMGAVLKARHEKMRRVDALKIIRKERLNNPDALKRFEREVRAAAQLDHPNIVRAYHADEVNGTHFLAMEYVAGKDLGQAVKERGAMPITEACDCIRQAALGLQHANEQGLVHRDIKPSNLLLATGGVVKILDFGLARLTSVRSQASELTHSGAVMGTPDFIAPEQALDSRDVDIRADLYSLGCTFYFLLTAQPPFQASTLAAKLLQHQMEEPRPVEQLRPGVPFEAVAIVRKLMAKNPGLRYQRPTEVAAALQRWAAMPRNNNSRLANPPVRNTAAVSEVETIDLDQADVSPLGSAGAQRPKGRSPTRKRRMLGLSVGLAILLLVPLAWLLWPKAAPAPDNRSVQVPTATFTNALGMEFVLVPRGKSWLRGGGGKFGDQEVEFRADFYLGKYEVTQEEWEKVMEKNPSHFSRTGAGRDAVKDIPDADLKRFPVEMVSWNEVQVFLTRLNTQTREAGWVYRLPKEVEWEYACRGGPMADRFDSAFDYYCDKPRNQLRPDQANTDASRKGRTCKVGSYQPNCLGLYDMHGNLHEWCDDANTSAVDMPRRMLRGGGWNVSAGAAQASYRYSQPLPHGDNGLGLRLARVPITEPSAVVDGFVPLLNGKDLTGWKTHPSQPGNWRVDNGILTASGPSSISHLYTERGDYKDFHLRMEVRIFENSNSGVFFRSSAAPTHGGGPVGHNAKFCDNPDNWNGGLFVGPLPMVRARETPARPGQWVTFEIVAEGNHLVVKLDGAVTAEFTDVKHYHSVGHIVLQQHGPTTVVEFRKIEIKELGSKP
jgi:serine/threonine protein kinase